MKILIKPKYSYLKLYKNADAFLFGIKKLSSFQTREISIEKLTKIVNKYKDKEIFVSIDKNIFNEDLELLKQSLIAISKLNIKGLFFYDLAVLYLVEKLKLNIPLIWNQDFLTTNYKTCAFYEKQNVKGIKISSVLTTDEIIEISEKTKLTTFVDIFGYQLMAFSNRKLITNYFSYINKKNMKKNNYIIERNKKYLIKENTSGTMFISDYILNGYSKIEKLKNIDYLIANEFMINHFKFNQTINILKEKNNPEKLQHLYKNLSTGFFDKKTIYKVK